MTADFGNMCMKLNFMNTHRVVQNSLEPYRSSKSSQKQSKSADMAQTGYAIEKWHELSIVTLDSWSLGFVYEIKLYESSQSGSELIGAL